MNLFKLIFFTAGFGALALAGCNSKPDPDRELQKAAVVMAEPAPAQPVAAPTSASAPAGTPVQPAVAPATEMNQAVAAYKAGNLDDAVTRLQKLRAAPVLTPQQRIAINDAMAAVMSEIYTLAAKGDSRAVQAVKQYEQLQTQRR